MAPLVPSTIRSDDTSLIDATRKLEISPSSSASIQVRRDACIRQELSQKSVGLPDELIQIIADYVEELTPINIWVMSLYLQVKL